ncbi:MAG: hypothetical protein ACE5GY_06540 [Thermodesulfobacteriota bacterium]
MRTSKISALAVAFITMLFIIFSASGAHAEARRRGRISVKAEPMNFSFDVDSRGEPSGRNWITIKVSRSDPPTGAFKRCKKIKLIIANVNSKPGVEKLSGNRMSWHSINPIGSATLDKPLCSFTDVPIYGSPFTPEMIRAACKDNAGRTVTMRKELSVWLLHSIGGNNWITYGKGQGERAPVIRAQIRCAGAFRAAPVEPVAIAQGSGGGAAGGGSSGGQTGPLCDLSGNWRQRNTQSNYVLPLVWKFESKKNEGSQQWRNYEVTRYKDGRRFSPPASGRLFQSAREALLFYDTPASVSRYKVSRITSLRTLRVRPGCEAMDVLGGFTSQTGTVAANSPFVLERMKQDGAGRVTSPVGRPTLKGRQPIWQKDRRPVIKDDTLKEDVLRKQRMGY